MVGRLDTDLADDVACSPDNDGCSNCFADRTELLREEPASLFTGVRVVLESGVTERQSGDCVFGADEECIRLHESDCLDS